MLATHRIEPCVQYTQSEDKSWWWLLHRGGPTPDPHTQDMVLGVPRDRREKGRKVSLGKAPLGYAEDQRKREDGNVGSRYQGWKLLEPHLSQLESWLWLAAISRMSSISSSMRKGCCEVGSSSGHEYGLM